MTNEEKAKAYDEALDRCKEWASSTCGHSVADSPKDVAEFIFPQLAEGEDERIRKTILTKMRACQKQSNFFSNDEIAYLEKQKESQELPLMNGDSDLYFDTWRQEVPVPTFRQCFEEGMRYAQRLQKEQKPKQVPKWLYRLEFKDNSCGLWYNGQGEWCFENGIGSLDDSCKTKDLPMDYDERYKQDGRNWFSSCSKKEDLLHWYSKEDAKTLLNKGFVFTRYLATEYHEYDQQTVFIKETSLYREEINFLELMKEQKPAEWSEEDKSFYNSIMCEVIEEGMHPTPEQANWLKSLPERFVLQPKQEWSEEDEKWINYFYSLLGLACEKDIHGLGQKAIDAKMWLKSLRPQPKQEWSKEDEQRITEIEFAVMQMNTQRVDTKDKCLAWLKSLRPQSKQEWSEEDKKMLWVIQLALTKHPITDKQEKDAFDWLNSLRPQPHTVHIKDATKFGNLEYKRGVKDGIQSEKSRQWKPSEDEVRLINTSISFLKDFADKGYENAVECIDWLKSKLNGNTCK